jgi:hypothetical protein
MTKATFQDRDVAERIALDGDEVGGADVPNVQRSTLLSQATAGRLSIRKESPRRLRNLWLKRALPLRRD